MGRRWNDEDQASGVPVFALLGMGAAMVEVANAVQVLTVRSSGARCAEYLRLLADQAEAFVAPAPGPSPSAS